MNTYLLGIYVVVIIHDKPGINLLKISGDDSRVLDCFRDDMC